MTTAWFFLLAGLLGLTFGSAPAWAGDLQSWNGFELKVLDSGRMTWDVGGHIRVGDHLSNPFDRRVGTSLTFDLGAGMSFEGGYLLRHKDYPGVSEIDWDHRFIGGLTYPISRRFLLVEGTTQYERIVGQPGIQAFSRYRQQFEIERTREKISPLLYEDLTFRNNGLVRSRSRIGARWQIQPGYAVAISYQFESIREGSAWRPRHAIYTEFEIDRPAILEGR